MALVIQLRNGLDTEWTSVNPVLAQGELGLETNTSKIKIGNGTSNWNTLPYTITSTINWAQILGIPSTFPPSAHTHLKSDISNFAHTHLKSEISDFAHTHLKSDITNFAHTHVKADITDFAHTHLKADISDFAHTHLKSEISDFAHTHPITEVVKLNSELLGIASNAGMQLLKTGQYVDQSDLALASGTRRISNNNDIEYVAVSFPRDTTIDQLGIAVSGNASGIGSIAIYDSYESGANQGWPHNKLFETGNINTAITGYTAATVSFTFLKNKLYWFGVYTSLRPALRTISTSAMPGFGLNGSNGTTYFSGIASINGATPQPNTITLANLIYNSNAPISVRFRILS